MLLDLAVASTANDADLQASWTAFEHPPQSGSAPRVPFGTHAPAPSREAVQAQLYRLRAEAFAGSSKLYTFLEFVVAEALDGRGATLKELVIGDALYGGVEPYDPRIDSTVRVEARRLRKKLDTYYQGPGAGDRVRISIPSGSYAPLFAHSDLLGSVWAAAASAGREKRAMDEQIGLIVLPFTTLSPGGDEARFADGLTDEVIFAAGRTSRFRLAARALVFQYRGVRFSLTDVVAETGCDLVLHGTVRRCGDIHRISLELVERTGRVLWSDRLDGSASCDLTCEEVIAGAIVQRLLATDVLPQGGSGLTQPRNWN